MKMHTWPPVITKIPFSSGLPSPSREMAAVPLAVRQLSSAIGRSIFFPTSTTSPFRRSLGLRPCGLRLPASFEPSSDSDSESQARDKKSRNEKKRVARRAVQWGMELADFSNPQIKRVLRLASLDGEVYDALMLVKRLGPDVREGKRRQFNFIGRLLRDVQPELMDALIQASKDGDSAKLQSLAGEDNWTTEEDEEDVEEIDNDEEVSSKHVEVAARWFEGLIDKDSSITNEVYSSIHSFEYDRQELRKLVRRVHLSHAQIDENGEIVNSTELNIARKSLVRFLQRLARLTSIASIEA